MTSSLAGIGDSPIPRIAREFRFAQSGTLGAGSPKEVVLVANKTTAGSETVETLPQTAILSQSDCDTRYGARSEIRWQYFAYRLIDPEGTVKAVAVAENGSAAAASVVFTFTTTADDNSAINIEWGGLKVQVPVASGDTAIVQCAAVVAKINSDPNWPFTAIQQSPSNDHKATVTCANLGPRGDFIVSALRISYATVMASSVAKAAITSGTGADDFTNALTALASTTFRYHAPACTANSSVTSTDSGVGEYCQFIRNQAAPSVGKDQIVIFGLDCSQSQAASVTASSAANTVFAKFFRLKSNDFSPAMNAAHHAAVIARARRQYAAANLAGYTSTDTTPYAIPDPFIKTNRPTATEVAADLNNGVSAVGFTPNGQAYIVREINAYNFLGTSTTKDYRAREGHIPDVIFDFWQEVYQRYLATKQPNVAADPPQGVRPIQGFTYPSAIRALIFSVINDLCGPFQDGKALLDPGVIDEMKASVSVKLDPAGFTASATPQPVRHNLFNDWIVNQSGPAY